MSASTQSAKDFRPRRHKPDLSLGPDGKPSRGGGDLHFFTKKDFRPKTNAERQQAWRDRHRPRRQRPDFSLGPDGKPNAGGTSQTYFPKGSFRPMTNAERQQRWRDKHRGTKRKYQFDGPQGSAGSTPSFIAA